MIYVDNLPVDDLSVDDLPVDDISVDDLPVDDLSVGELSVRRVKVTSSPYVPKTTPSNNCRNATGWVLGATLNQVLCEKQ